MIYFCADDFGLCKNASKHILDCVEKGILNKVSVFPNFDMTDFQTLLNFKDVRLSLHLNLVEGRCMAPADEVKLLADEKGNFKFTFGGLLKESILHRKEFETQLYKEIKAQVLFWKSVLPEDREFCIDSHQHTHMIPSVFRMLLRVLEDENIKPSYIRIPTEPPLLYVKTPSLYFTYSPVNVVKQWLLDFFWLFNKRNAGKNKIQTSLFMGILFSGKMDEKRVKKLLPQYVKEAKKRRTDVEILFHPGYLEKDEAFSENDNVVFGNFYFSENRKTEYDTLINLSEGSVGNALY